jgi:CBS domain-containing protein
MMRALPRIINDAGEEFLKSHFPYGFEDHEIYERLFDKGDAWPVCYEHRSHVIDLAVYREITRGRKVFLDYAQNPRGLDMGRLDVGLASENGSAMIIESGLPVGMLTERDLCYRIVAEGRDPRMVKVEEVMSKPLITLSKGRTLSEALALMGSRRTRRLVLVNADGTVFGLVTRWGFTGEGGQGVLPLPVNHAGKGKVCPFCASVLEDAEALSKHIDRIHIGGELASGSSPTWTQKEKIGGN